MQLQDKIARPATRSSRGRSDDVATPRLDSLRQGLNPAAGPATLSHGVLVFVLKPAELLATVQRLKDEFGSTCSP